MTGRLPVALGVIGVEIGSAVAALAPITRTAGLSIAAIAFLGFGVAIARVLVRGAPVSCLCFGSAGGELRVAHLVRNAGLATVAVLGALGADSGVAVSSVGAVTAVGAGLVVALWITSLDAWLDFLAPRNPTEVS